MASDGPSEPSDECPAYFGWTVALDGDTALIGAPEDNEKGSAYVFTRSGSTWTEQAKLAATDGAGSRQFGRSLALDGDTALIGAFVPGSGSVYSFANIAGVWTEQTTLIASDEAVNDLFGISVDLDLGAALIGAIGDDDNGENSGSAYLFTRSDSTWTEQAKLVASDGAEGTQFGFSVALDGGIALIGAPFDDDGIGDVCDVSGIPTQPGSLRYEIYSKTAAELFWDRSIDDVLVVGYEIKRNGEIVTTIDALSYFTNELIPQQSYEFTVIAIDSNGNRSALATVVFIGGDRSTSINDLPLPPENLHAEVYSQSAFELFWDRAKDVFLAYEISIDGQPVVTTNGISWFIEGLQSGRRYLVDVVAINALGN